jgi:hypothetical protein
MNHPQVSSKATFPEAEFPAWGKARNKQADSVGSSEFASPAALAPSQLLRLNDPFHAEACGIRAYMMEALPIVLPRGPGQTSWLSVCSSFLWRDTSARVFVGGFDNLGGRGVWGRGKGETWRGTLICPSLSS